MKIGEYPFFQNVELARQIYYDGSQAGTKSNCEISLWLWQYTICTWFDIFVGNVLAYGFDMTWTIGYSIGYVTCNTSNIPSAKP